jgi:hypothetical protein
MFLFLSFLFLEVLIMGCADTRSLSYKYLGDLGRYGCRGQKARSSAVRWLLFIMCDVILIVGARPLHGNHAAASFQQLNAIS